jgi:hypothetical protein
MQKVSFQGRKEFSDMGECEKDLWVTGKMSRCQQRDILSLVMEFSDGIFCWEAKTRRLFS